MTAARCATPGRRLTSFLAGVLISGPPNSCFHYVKNNICNNNSNSRNSDTKNGNSQNHIASSNNTSNNAKFIITVVIA